MSKNKVKIWHISDTHSFHGLLKVPNDIDVILHSGDASNYKDPYKNEQEMLDFIEWYGSLDTAFKIYVAGNHDTSVEKKFITRKTFEDKGIIYLENESVEILGINIFGSPITPTFGQWSFMKSRNKMHQIWDNIPPDTNIIVTHGPPKGKLDLSIDHYGNLEFCGCNNLRKRVLELQNLQLITYGHIHNCEGIINAGIIKESVNDIIYSNGSVVTDGKFGKLSSNGNIIELTNIYGSE